MFKIAHLAGAAVFVLMLTGCGKGVDTCPVYNMRNGIYHFGCRGSAFALELSKFKEQNPSLDLVSTEGSDLSGERGTTVVTELSLEMKDILRRE